MKNLKAILRSSLLIAIIFSFTLITAYAASSNFSFTMYTNGRVIDGSANGVYHTLGSGTPRISGTLTTTGVQQNLSYSNTLYIQLYSKSTGKSYGRVTVKPSTSYYGVASISGSYSSVPAGSYYLYIYRAESDGLSYQGNGTLSN